MKKTTPTIMSFLPQFYIDGVNGKSPEYQNLTATEFITKKDKLIESVVLSRSIQAMISKVPLTKCLEEAALFHLSGCGRKKNCQAFYDDFKKEHEKVTFFFTVEEFVRFLTGLMQVEYLTIFMMRHNDLCLFVDDGIEIRPVLVECSRFNKTLKARFLRRCRYVGHFLISNPTEEE